MRIAPWPPAGRIEPNGLEAEARDSVQSASCYLKRQQSLCLVAFSAAC